MEEEEARPSFYCPFQYIPADHYSEDNSYDSLCMNNRLNLISDESIDLKDCNGYANLNFFLSLGIPAESWVVVHAFYEGAKEEDVIKHVLCVNLSESIGEIENTKVTQSQFVHVNPVVYMNLTNSKKNTDVLVKPINFELLNHDPNSPLGINLPKIKELKVSCIKGLKKSKDMKNTMKEYISSLSAPIPVKVNDIIYVPKLDLYKVNSIVFEKDEKEDITKLGLKLSKTIEVSQLSYSKYHGYLLDPKYITSIDISSKRISAPIPDLSYIMDNPFNVLNGFQYKFLDELRNYFTNHKSDDLLQVIIIETQRRNQIDSILQGLAYNLNMVYDKESALDYCSITGIKSMIESIGTSMAPGVYHITHFKYLNLILEQSSTGQPSKKEKDSIEIRLSNILKESIANLEQNLISKSEKLYLFIEVDRLMDVFSEIRQMSKVLSIPNPEDDDDIVNLISRKDLVKLCNDKEAYLNFVPKMPKVLKKRCIDDIWGIMRKCINIYNTTEKLNDETSLDEQYFNIAQKVIKKVDDLQKSFGDSPLKVPEVKWKDVGGLGLAKHDILQTIELPLRNPSLFKNGLIQRGGLLLYGPPGTGKTLLAKAIATECELNFMSVKGPEVLNMYVGESEKNIREIFEKARSNSPCVIFFDELDSLAPARGNGSDSNQVMDRIVAQLLTEIDGVNSKGQVFVIGATNRPDLLDPALLRPGRFDKKIYLGIAKEPEERIKIIKAQTRKFKLDQDVDFEQIEQLIPKNFTGADFSGFTNEAYMQATRRKIAEVDEYLKQNNLDTTHLSCI